MKKIFLAALALVLAPGFVLAHGIKDKKTGQSSTISPSDFTPAYLEQVQSEKKEDTSYEGRVAEEKHEKFLKKVDRQSKIR